MDNNSSNAGRDAGNVVFCLMLTITFTILRLLHVITWSWIWILSPLWIPLAFALFFCIIVLILHIKDILKKGF